MALGHWSRLGWQWKEGKEMRMNHSFCVS